ncbi:MAG: DUF2339 domain-containing protein [Planctomycetaceae bacterium]
MPFVVLIFMAVVVWLVASPFIVMNLWNRLTDLESTVQRLQKLLQARLKPAQESLTFPVEDAIATRVPPAPTTTPPLTPPVLAASSVVDEIMPNRWLEEPVLADSPKLQPVLSVVSQERTIDDVDRSPVALEDRTSVKSPSTATAVEPITSDEPSTLEEILAGKWLTWVGALAVIIGAGFGFKYAVENGWLDPSRRVILGLLVGLLSFAGGAFAMRRDYRFLGQGLTGAAMGVLYMSCFAAHVWYGLVSYELAFLGMALTTAGGLAFAARFDSQPTAFLGLLGGFLTPAMLHGSTDQFWILFPYILLLDAGVLYVATQRRWLGLQNLAFVGTGLTWWTWYVWYYDDSKLAETVSFLSAFFGLFALIGVMQNIVRQQKAVAGDFFLILAAPIAYFGALYGLTYELFPYWQGAFALGMTVIYGGLAILNARINSQGKPVAAVLAGLAGTFLVIAAPLQFTGHWVTIAWIAESVLLVEIGLRYHEKTLTVTGLSLLAKVQFILLIYAFATFADPVGFQTAFVRKQFHLINGPAAMEVSWTNIFNGRSFSYLVDIVGMAWLAVTCRRRAKAGQTDDLFGMNGRDLETWLTAAVPLIGLMLAITETFVWGMVRNWHSLSILSGFTMWAALAGVIVIAWSVLIGPRPLEKLGWALFVLMGGALILSLVWTCDGVAAHSVSGDYWLEQWWLMNPRGMAFLSVIVASVLSAMIYGTSASLESSEESAPNERIPLDRLFGSGAFVLGLVMVLLETFAWAETRNWMRVSILNSFIVWTSLFGAGLATWKFVRRSIGLDSLLVLTFVLLGGFLAMDSIVTLGQAEQAAGSSAVSVTNDSLAEAATDWWLFNPRGLSFLLAIGATLLAGSLERSLRLTQSPAVDLPGNATTRGEQFGLMACFVGLTVVWLETLASVLPQRWLADTIASSLAIGTAPFALGLAIWATWFRRRALNGAVATAYALLGASLFVSAVTSLDGNSTIVTVSPEDAAVRLWLLHPRGGAFLIGIAVGGLAAAFYLNAASRRSEERPFSEFETESLMYSQFLGVSSWLAGLAMFTVEAIAQGAARHWQTETSLAITLSWTAFALGTLIAGIYWRSGTVRVLALSVFVLTVAKVFLFDVWHLETVIRVFAFVSLGVTLLLVSFLYRHYRERIRNWIAPAA